VLALAKMLVMHFVWKILEVLRGRRERTEKMRDVIWRYTYATRAHVRGDYCIRKLGCGVGDCAEQKDERLHFGDGKERSFRNVEGGAREVRVRKVPKKESKEVQSTWLA
jgi:hypothetical protein